MTRVPPSSVATSDALWLLDTDVVSELRKAPLGRCDPRVRDWATSIRSSQTRSVLLMRLVLWFLSR